MVKGTFILITCFFISLQPAFCWGEWEQSEDNKSEEKKEVSYTDWPCFRGDQALSGYADISMPDNLSLSWIFKTGDAIMSTPVISQNMLYLSSTDGTVYALDLKTGTVSWEFHTEDYIEASPLIVKDKLYFGTLFGNFYAIRLDNGQEVWQFQAENQIIGSANWVQNGNITTILFGSYDNYLYCLEADTGKIQWKYRSESYINGSPSVYRDMTIFGGCDAFFHILSIYDGTLLGKIDAGSYIAASCAIRDGKAYIGHYGGLFICFNLEEKKIEWTYENIDEEAAFFSSPAVNHNYVVAGSRDNRLYCFQKDTGELLWSFKTNGHIDSSPVILKEKVIFGSTDGRVYLLNMQNGEELWSYELGSPVTSSPAVTTNMLFFGAEDGRLYAFKGQDGGL
jgi:outer membrane protein assembly factor BamB